MHLPPFLRPICDLMAPSSRRVSTPKREPRKGHTQDSKSKAVTHSITETRALVTRRMQECGQVDEEFKGAQVSPATSKVPRTLPTPPTATDPPMAQLCCALTAKVHPHVPVISKLVHAILPTECEIEWWLQRDRVRRICKRLRSRKIRGRQNCTQVNNVPHAVPVQRHAVRPSKLLVKKKIKGWEKRAASRRRLHTRSPSSSGSWLGLMQGSMSFRGIYVFHVFTLLILRCTPAVTWLTDLILSSGLIRGRIS